MPPTASRATTGRACPVGHPDLCPCTRSSRAGCRLCQIVCPADCLDIGPGRLEIGRNCTACGACHAVCPTGALIARGPGDAEIGEEAAAAPLPAVACARTGRFAGVVTVPCLARVTAAALLRLAGRGVEKLHLLRGDCARCPNATAYHLAFDRSYALHVALARAAGMTPLALDELQIEDQAPAQGRGLTRREVFSRCLPRPTAAVGAAAALRTEVEAMFENAGADGTCESLPMGIPEISGNCDACGACASVCPSGAIEIDRRAPDAVHLQVRSHLCSACDACVEVCGPAALRVRRGWIPPSRRREPQATVRIALGACADCGAPVSPGEELCVGCSRRRGPSVPAERCEGLPR